MKLHLSAVSLLLLLSPSLSLASDAVAFPLHPDMPPAALLPIASASAEPRATMRLRDVLRQPYEEVKEDNKPYRLSVQERQRLREQLGSQSLDDFTKK